MQVFKIPSIWITAFFTFIIYVLGPYKVNGMRLIEFFLCFKPTTWWAKFTDKHHLTETDSPYDIIRWIDLHVIFVSTMKYLPTLLRYGKTRLLKINYPDVYKNTLNYSPNPPVNSSKVKKPFPSSSSESNTDSNCSGDNGSSVCNLCMSRFVMNPWKYQLCT